MSSPNDDDGPDLIDLTGNIGTWVAAGMAIIALVGVVGPLLAIQASMSDRNRAMNAVAQPQKYISRGIRLTKGLRVFRRIRVPDLAPGYITNEPDKSPLAATLHLALGRWALRPAEYTPWGPGWAKFSELIEAYEIRDETSNAPVELGVPATGGSLEIVNSRTALVVHKHWIMLLGLLGRYGDRADKGMLQKTGVRRDIEGERASIQRFQFPRKAVEEKRRAPRRGRSSCYSGTSVSSSGFDRDSDSDSDSNSNSDSDAQPIGIVMRRSKYGVITFGPSPQPTIYGITGAMEALGRHKGSWSYLTSISFVPHTAREIFASGVRERQEHCSLQTLFWLAHGFLPHGGTREGRQTVVSLEGPGPLDVGLDHPECLSDDWPAYSLQESDEIPVSMGLMMRRLGIPEPKVLQFLPVNAATQEKRITEALEEKTRNEDTASEAPALSSLTVTDLWVYYSRPSQYQFYAFRKTDMERVLTLILTLEWDDWGFLILKDKLWISLLRKTVDILEVEELPKSAIAKTTGLSALLLLD
ncbi:hypothetical protein FDECE_12226 [Fusarium decemcellulare]|nr:hypothetical protein FDECE_12226 [Fusarium decemcellulare]